MITLILEILFEILIEFIVWTILALPGAAVLWIKGKRKISIEEILKQRLTSAMVIGVLCWAGLGGILFLALR